MSHGWPAKWTGTIALVLSVIFPRIFSVSMFRVSGSISASTGLAPPLTIMLTVAAKVIGVVITSSVGARPKASKARWRPAVAELKGTA